jgi:hypothetical protein
MELIPFSDFRFGTVGSTESVSFAHERPLLQIFAFFIRKSVSCISLWHWQIGCCSKISEREARCEIDSSILKVVSCDTTSLKSVLHRIRFLKINSFLFCVYLISIVSCVFMPYSRSAILKVIIRLCAALVRPVDIHRTEGCLKWKLSVFDVTGIFFYTLGLFFKEEKDFWSCMAVLDYYGWHIGPTDFSACRRRRTMKKLLLVQHY